MKLIRLFLVIFFAAGLFLSSCELSPDHSIRVKNDYSETINNVTIGSVEYGSVESGSMTDYKPVDEGTHDLTVSTATGSLSGTVSVEGNGEHNWTLTIKSDGNVKIEEDK